jgi:hypothetical protein
MSNELLFTTQYNCAAASEAPSGIERYCGKLMSRAAESDFHTEDSSPTATYDSLVWSLEQPVI